MEKENQFLNKNVTIRKIDGTYLRGTCVSENPVGVTVAINSKEVFVPFAQVSEIVAGGAGEK